MPPGFSLARAPRFQFAHAGDGRSAATIFKGRIRIFGKAYPMPAAWRFYFIRKLIYAPRAPRTETVCGRALRRRNSLFSDAIRRSMRH
jgi:hypothetical protein